MASRASLALCAVSEVLTFLLVVSVAAASVPQHHAGGVRRRTTASVGRAQRVRIRGEVWRAGHRRWRSVERQFSLQHAVAAECICLNLNCREVID